MSDAAHLERSPRQVGPGNLGMTQRIAVTLAMLAAAYALSRVPAPGIDPHAFANLAGNAALDAVAQARLSLIALQFTPVYSALVVFEVFKLALPGMANWDTTDPAQSRRINRGLLILAFALALWQGWGVAFALEDMTAAGTRLIEEPGSVFRWTFALTQVAATAGLILIADTITRFGIGSGFWVMLVAFEVAALPAVLASLSQYYAQGEIDPLMLLVIAVIIVAAAAATLALYRARIAGGHAPQAAARDLILPPFLGVALGSLFYGLALLPGLLLGGLETESLQRDGPLRLALTAGAIAIVALLRIKDDRARALQIAALGSAIFVALEFMGARLGTLIVRADIVVIAVMVCALAFHHGSTKQPQADRA